MTEVTTLTSKSQTKVIVQVQIEECVETSEGNLCDRCQNPDVRSKRQFVFLQEESLNM